MSLPLKEKAIGCLLPDRRKEKRASGKVEGGLGRERVRKEEEQSWGEKNERKVSVKAESF